MTEDQTLTGEMPQLIKPHEVEAVKAYATQALEGELIKRGGPPPVSWVNECKKGNPFLWRHRDTWAMTELKADSMRGRFAELVASSGPIGQSLQLAIEEWARDHQCTCLIHWTFDLSTPSVSDFSVIGAILQKEL